MARTIWKFILDAQPTTMPKGAEIIHVQMQHGNLCIWVIVDPGNATEDRMFEILGTGQDVPVGLQHIHTFLDGAFVWHVFEPGEHK